MPEVLIRIFQVIDYRKPALRFITLVNNYWGFKYPDCTRHEQHWSFGIPFANRLTNVNDQWLKMKMLSINLLPVGIKGMLPVKWIFLQLSVTFRQVVIFKVSKSALQTYRHLITTIIYLPSFLLTNHTLGFSIIFCLLSKAPRATSSWNLSVLFFRLRRWKSTSTACSGSHFPVRHSRE